MSSPAPADSRLIDLFLDLVIDHEQKVAFTRQVVSEDLDVPILLRKASLTFLETALLLFLRQKANRHTGEKAGFQMLIFAFCSVTIARKTVRT